MRFCFEIVGDFDSEKLWKDIKRPSLNMVDLGEQVYIHGSLSTKDLVAVLEECCLYGRLQGSVHY